ncbi:MAG: hypothetical protein V7K77_07150 [Nostoc sp.]
MGADTILDWELPWCESICIGVNLSRKLYRTGVLQIPHALIP